MRFHNQKLITNYNNLNINKKKKVVIFFLLENMITLFKKYICQIYLLNGIRFISIKLKSPTCLKPCLILLKYKYQFKMLSDMVAVDYLHKKNIFNFGKYISSENVYDNYLYTLLEDDVSEILLDKYFYRFDDMRQFDTRYQLNYVLYSLEYNWYLNVSVAPQGNITGNDNIDSIINIYKNANWLERECWDMFGLLFVNHPDLRRILTDYGFNGFPLRKDFPVYGFVELKYDEEQKVLLYQPVELTQAFRYYKFINPWDPYADA